MAEKDKGSLDFSRRDFFRLASTGAMMFAASALPGGTALAATTERSKPAHGSRARNTLKAAGNKGKADLLILGNVITMDEYKPFAQAVAVRGDTILYVGTPRLQGNFATAARQSLIIEKIPFTPASWRRIVTRAQADIT